MPRHPAETGRAPSLLVHLALRGTHSLGDYPTVNHDSIAGVIGRRNTDTLLRFSRVHLTTLVCSAPPPVLHSVVLRPLDSREVVLIFLHSHYPGHAIERDGLEA